DSNFSTTNLKPPECPHSPSCTAELSSGASLSLCDPGYSGSPTSSAVASLLKITPAFLPDPFLSLSCLLSGPPGLRPTTASVESAIATATTTSPPIRSRRAIRFLLSIVHSTFMPASLVDRYASYYGAEANRGTVFGGNGWAQGGKIEP